MPNFDGGTKGKTTKEVPTNSQKTDIIQVNYDSKQKAEEFLFPKAWRTSVSAGEGAVSSFPVKY